MISEAARRLAAKAHFPCVERTADEVNEGDRFVTPQN
jgi:hypothetical protein